MLFVKPRELERVNTEVKRRPNVVSICPNEAAMIRLVSSGFCEQHDEERASKRYFGAGSMAKSWSETRS